MIVDLSMPGSDVSSVRQSLEAFAGVEARPALFVKVSPLAEERTLHELGAVGRAPVDGVFLPAVKSGADLQHLGALLAAIEAEDVLPDGALGIIASLDRGASFLALASLVRASARLCALAWDGEALAADLGAVAARDQGGNWIQPCAVARFQTLAAAAAAGVPAIDAPLSVADVRREAQTARADGFAGKLARDAAQAALIDEVFA